MSINIEQARLHPEEIFNSPMSVVRNKDLTLKEKKDILQSWAYDERELSVAEEENMPGRDSEQEAILDKILKALLKLGINENLEPTPPTKHG